MAHDNESKERVKALEEEKAQLLDRVKLLHKKADDLDRQVFDLSLECNTIPTLISQRREAQKQRVEAVSDFQVKEAGYQAEIAFLRTQLNARDAENVQLRKALEKSQEGLRFGQHIQIMLSPKNGHKRIEVEPLVDEREIKKPTKDETIVAETTKKPRNGKKLSRRSKK